LLTNIHIQSDLNHISSLIRFSNV